MAENIESQETYLLKFSIPDDIKTLYVNEMAIQEMQTEFILSFFEVRLPITPEKDVPLKPLCASRIAISVERIPDMIRVLQERLDTYHKRKESVLPEEVKE